MVLLLVIGFIHLKNLTGYDTEIKCDVNYNVTCNH